VPPGSETGTGPTWRAGRAVVPVQRTTPMYVVVAPSPPPRPRRGAIAVVLLSALFAMCCIGGATLAFMVNTSKPTAALGPALPGLNTAVKDGKFEFVIASVSCGHPSVSRAFVSRPAQGQFCLVALSVRNVGTKSQTFADAFQKANGPTGDSYAADTAAGLLANTDGANVWTLINPGNKVSGTIVFDIPASATISTVELHDSALSHGVTIQVT
jgi:Domain of unknown function (DUF4352)